MDRLIPEWAKRPLTITGAVISVFGGIASILTFLQLDYLAVALMAGPIPWSTVGPISFAVALILVGTTLMLADQHRRLLAGFQIPQAEREELDKVAMGYDTKWPVNQDDFSDISLSNGDIEYYYPLTQQDALRVFDDVVLVSCDVLIEPFAGALGRVEMLFAYGSTLASRRLLVKVDDRGEVSRLGSPRRDRSNYDATAQPPWRAYPDWKGFLRIIRQKIPPLAPGNRSRVHLTGYCGRNPVWFATVDDAHSGDEYRWEVTADGEIREPRFAQEYGLDDEVGPSEGN